MGVLPPTQLRLALALFFLPVIEFGVESFQFLFYLFSIVDDRAS